MSLLPQRGECVVAKFLKQEIRKTFYNEESSRFISRGFFYGRQFFALRLRFAPVVCRKKKTVAANGLLPLGIAVA